MDLGLFMRFPDSFFLIRGFFPATEAAPKDDRHPIGGGLVVDVVCRNNRHPHRRLFFWVVQRPVRSCEYWNTYPQLPLPLHLRMGNEGVARTAPVPLPTHL
jgi:hypothetical protein